MNIQKSRPSADSKPGFNYGYIIVMASFIIIMMNVGLYLTIGVFFKPISNDLGWTRAATSLPITVSTTFTAIASIVAGAMVSKLGPRKIVLIFAITTGVGYLLMSRLTSLWQFYLYFGILIGAGAGLMTPLLSIIPRWFSNRRTVMAGVISAGGGVGGLIMPLAADWLISSYGWHRAYLIMGIVYLIVMLIAAQFLKRSPAAAPLTTPVLGKTPKPSSSQLMEDNSLKRVFQSPYFWMMLILCFGFGYVANTINLHTVPHATDININPTAAAGLLSIMNGVSIIGCVVLGAVGDRFGNKMMLIITFIVEGLVLFSLVYIRDLWMLNLSIAIYGLVFGSGLAQTSPLVAKLFGLGSLGLLLGIINFAQTFGSGIGAFIAGFIYDSTGSYNWAFIICALICLVAMIATSLIRGKTADKKGFLV